MTVRGNLFPALLALSLAACTTDSILPDRRPDYRGSQTTPTLEVPPDLTSSTLDDTLAVPELQGAGTASLSAYAGERQAGSQAAGGSSVLIQPEGMSIRSEGEQRWLSIQAPPDVVWSRVQDFWLSAGIGLTQQDARIGIMETEWLENRADIPGGPIRALLSKAIDFAYSAPTRDKFRVRLERSDAGTDVFLTHYGLEEVLDGPDRAVATPGTRWQSRPRDPELEAEMLRRLMVSLGASEARAEAQLTAGGGDGRSGPATQMDSGPGGEPRLIVMRDYNTAWRLVGLALDGGDFVVEDQNRGAGRYIVEYRDPQLIGEQQDEDGLLSSLAFWRDTDRKEGSRHQVRLAGQGDRTVVVVQDMNDQPETPDRARAILEHVDRTIR